MNAAQQSIIWTVQKAIQDQVEVEDLVAWCSREPEVIPTLHPIPDSKPNRSSVAGFVWSLLP